MGILRSAFVIGLITIISRILGYIRDAIIAATIGAGVINDAFIAAFRFTNLFRVVFGEGAFNAAFIPLLMDIRSKRNNNDAVLFAAHTQSFLLISTITLSIVVVVFMPYIMLIFTPGFWKEPIALNLAINIGRITFPYLIAITLASFYGSILSSRKIFAPYSAASIILNIIMIIAMLIININGITQDNAMRTVYALGCSVIVAGVLEVLWMYLFMIKYGCVTPFVRPKMTTDVKIVGKKIIPGFVGAGISKINAMLNLSVLSFFPGGMSYMYYADRVAQLPLALFGTIIGTVLLPKISEEVTNGRNISMVKNKAITVSIYLVIPCAMGIFIFAHDIIDVLFGRGNFGIESINGTCNMLRILSLGLPSFALIKILVSIIHGHGDTKTPVKIAARAFVVNAFVSIILAILYGYVGVTIGTVVSSWYTVGNMMYFIKEQHKLYIENRTIKHIIITCFMSIFTMIIALWVQNELVIHNVGKVTKLLIIILCSSGIYFPITYRHIRRVNYWK